MGRKVFPYKQLTKAVLSTALITTSVGIVNINSGNIVYAESPLTIMSVPTLENGYSGEATKLIIQGYEATPFNEGDIFNVTVPSGVTWNETYTTEGTVTSATYERLDDRTIQFKVTGTPSELIIPINVNINGANEGDLYLTIDAPPNSSIPFGQVTFARVVGEVSEPVTINEFNDKVLINGSEVLADGGFYKVNNVVISPIRTVAEALGLQAEWKADTREIVFKTEETELVLSVDSNQYRLNGNVGQVEVKPIVHNGRTLVPLQFIIEAFGGTVEFKSDSQTPSETNLELELINKTSKSITISFGIDNLTGKYEIYRDNELIDTIQTNEKTTFTDKGLEPNSLYNYKVKLIKEDGQYEWTPSIEVTTEIDECFIATASYGSKFEPSVVILRNFRDSFLMTNSLGKSFVHFYYKYSPPIAKNIADSEIKKSTVRFLLRPFVSIAQYIVKK